MTHSRIMKIYQQEIACWKRLNSEQRGLILAFVFCMKLREAGTNFDEAFPDKPTIDYRAD